MGAIGLRLTSFVWRGAAGLLHFSMHARKSSGFARILLFFCPKMATWKLLGGCLPPPLRGAASPSIALTPILNGTSLNNALLALNWRYVRYSTHKECEARSPRTVSRALKRVMEALGIVMLSRCYLSLNLKHSDTKRDLKKKKKKKKKKKSININLGGARL